MLLKSRFEQLDNREKIVLLSSAVILTLILFYLLVIMPFFNKKQKLDNIIIEQQATLQWMYSAANEIQQLRVSPTVPTSKNTTSLLTLVDNQTASLGKVNKRIEPQGNQAVQISFEAVNFSALVQWLAALHRQQIQVIAMTIEPLATPDKVMARLTLQQ